jgi:hypothetical protein
MNKIASRHAQIERAIIENDETAFKKILDDMQGSTFDEKILCLAVTHERETFVSALLDGALSTHRMQALSQALEQKSSISQVILSHKAARPENNTFHLNQMLEVAASIGHMNAVDALFDMGVKPDREKAKDGVTQWGGVRNPLGQAAANGNLAMVEKLWPLIKDIPWREEALVWAAQCNHSPVALALWDRLPNAQFKAVEKALTASGGRSDLGCVLWSKLDPDLRTQKLDDMALVAAATVGNAVVAQAALKRADPNLNQAMALRNAVENHHTALIDLLVPASDVDLARKVWTGKLPRRWDLVNQLCLHLPEATQKAWVKQSPQHMAEALAGMRQQRAMAEGLGPLTPLPGRRRARP